MPHDATAEHLELFFASRADIFGRPSVSRSQNDQWLHVVRDVPRLRWYCALAPARRRCYRYVRRRFRLVHTICRVRIGLLFAGQRLRVVE